MLYSASTKGFYSNEIHGKNIPADAVEVSDEDYTALLEGQTKGHPIVHDDAGRPYNKLPAPPTVASVRSAKLASLAAKRYEIETGGVMVSGTKIKTDRESQALIDRTLARVQRRPAARINWKGAEGWVNVGRAEVEAIVAAVDDHVQACFDNEHAHAVAIQALATIEQIEAYDITTGWPGQE